MSERSYYLDDMALVSGQPVRCKATIGSPGFTVGKVYHVSYHDCGCTRHVAGVVNDNGKWVIPSARFQKVEKT